jgi:hypothetical protein
MSQIAPTRDDDPPHPNFDGIVFYPTTKRDGVVVTPSTGQSIPPISFLPIETAIASSLEISDLIIRIRRADPKSYLADYLDDMLQDFTDAIAACKPDDPMIGKAHD